MHQAHSVTASRAPASARDTPWKTAAWFVGLLAVFELALFGIHQWPGGSLARVHKYFDYGSSIETKMRRVVSEPDLPERHIFHAGWLDLARFPPAGESCDIAIYGMSFARELAATLRTRRPDLKLREVTGPGVPLSHTYTAYQMDVERRRAQAVMIPVLSDGIPYLRTMTHDTLFADHSQPVTWPRYALRAGHAVMVGAPVIHSFAQLKRALLGDRALWARHLAVLAEHDDYYARALYASHWTERLGSLRLVRRSVAHGRSHARREQLTTHAGFRRGTETAELVRVLLRQYIDEVRSHGEWPIVVLFDAPGEAHWLSALLGDVIERAQVPVVRSEDHCDASHLENFRPDGHYARACVRAIADDFIERYEAERSHQFASELRPKRP